MKPLDHQSKILNVKNITIIGILSAITIVLGLTPLGFIPVGPTRATIMHVPVILGAILYGPIVGMSTGLVFGLFSLFQAFTNPTITSFAFMNPFVSVVPRVMIGLIAGLVYKGSQKIGDQMAKWITGIVSVAICIYLTVHIYQSIQSSAWVNTFLNVGLLMLLIFLSWMTFHHPEDHSVGVVLGSLIGSLSNTFGVMTMIYIFFAERFVQAMDASAESAIQVIYGLGLLNGIPEAIVAMLLISAIYRAVSSRAKV